MTCDVILVWIQAGLRVAMIFTGVDIKNVHFSSLTQAVQEFLSHAYQSYERNHRPREQLT